MHSALVFRSEARTGVWTGFAAALIALVAPLLGGATQFWTQASIVCLLGLLFLLAPPQRSLGLAPNLLFGSIFLIALCAFIPARWGGVGAWRSALVNDFGVVLASTRTPQPWLTFETLVLLFAGGAWAYFVFSQVWEREAKQRVVQFLAGGLLLIAALAVGAHFFGYKIPFWPRVFNSNIDFGFFPNRNQTANVLALAGILTAALAYEDVKKKRKTAGLWFAGLVLLGVALVIAFSRAGILLFFVGTTVWALLAMRSSSSGKNLALTATALILLLTAFFIFGGETLNRFRSRVLDPQQDFRFLMQRDALNLSVQTPWLGVGLGNFEPLFRMNREFSVQQNRVLHPSSDWLWLAVEMGWLAPLALLGVLGWWLLRCRPFENKTAPAIRLAAAVCGVGFALHGLVDVSGHRLGTVLPALFIMGLALHPNRRCEPRFWVAPTFRVAGLALIIVGGCWLSSVSGLVPFPTSQTVEQLRTRAERAGVQGDDERLLESVTAALSIAPLDWRFYIQRAGAEANAYATADAIRDFRAARFLQPHWVEPCMAEGYAWLSVGRPEYVLEAWHAALHRAGEDGSHLFRRILETSTLTIELRDELRSWARGNPAYLLSYLHVASRWEFRVEAEALIFEEPDLARFSTEQRRQFFELWALKGDPARLVEILARHPDWQEAGWYVLATHFATEKDFRRAYEMVERFGTRPTLPKIDQPGRSSDLERDFVRHPDDLGKGVTLYTAQINERRFDDALRTVGKLKQIKARPRYVPFMEAELHARREDWERAWTAWQEFATGSGS